MTNHDDGLPNDPEGIRLMIHALVDGELDAAAALAVEPRIAAIAMATGERQAPDEATEPQLSAPSARPGLIAGTGASQRRNAETRPSQTRALPRARRYGSFDWRA